MLTAVLTQDIRIEVLLHAAVKMCIIKLQGSE